MKTVAIIPARGGSKRIPRKNIRPFRGQPMISWAIREALSSGLFDRVVVTTDDAEIAEVARASGAEVPFLRQADLANDHAGLTEVVQDAIRQLSLSISPPDMVCLIYATAPFLRAADLRDGLDRLTASDADYAISVASFPAPVERALVETDGQLTMMNQDNLFLRSQDLREAYHDAAQFVWGTAEAWLSDRRALRSPTIPVVLPRHRVQDIDTPEDWAFAELLAKVLEEVEA